MSHGTEARLLLQPKSHAQIRGCHVHQTEQLRAGRRRASLRCVETDVVASQAPAPERHADADSEIPRKSKKVRSVASQKAPLHWISKKTTAAYMALAKTATRK